jgi:hypothetical protein
LQPCIFLMLVTFKAEWWAGASWRRRQGFLFAGLFGGRFAQAPLHCAAAQVLRRLVVFFAVVAHGVFVLLADFVVSLVVFVLRPRWWIRLGPLLDMELLATSSLLA